MPKKFKKSYRKNKTGTTLKKLARDVRVLKNTKETKIYDFSISWQNDGQSVSMNEILQYIVQGTTQQTREGNKISVSGIRISGAFQSESSDAFNQHRITLAWSTSEGLASTDFISGATSYNFHIPQNSKKMNVIYDKINMDNQKTATGNVALYKFYKYISYRRKPKNIYYMNGVAIPSKNSLYVATVSDSLVTPYPESTYNIRIYYYDS